jgi:hypothetical protein
MPVWLAALLLVNLFALALSFARGAGVLALLCALAAAGTAALLAAGVWESRRKAALGVSPTVAPPLTIPSPAGPAPDRRSLIAETDSSRSRQWLKLVGECVDLVDELDRHIPNLDAGRQDLADHVICRLQEILERTDVQTISGEAAFDRGRHQVDSSGGPAVPGRRIAETLSPGFAVGTRVLRRARVKVADS